MKKSFVASIAVSVTVMVWLAIFAATASVPAAAPQSAAGQAKTAASGPLPKTPWDGKPDLTGTWGPATAGPGPNQDARSPTNAERRTRGLALDALYQPWARERSRALAYLDDPRYHCGPYGFPKYINIPDYFLLQIVQAPKETLVLVEYIYSGFRVISTDGSPHPKKIKPSYFGDSVGRWEGDTLVVDVTGFNGKIWLESGRPDAPQTTPNERGRNVFLTKRQAAQNNFGGGWISSDALHEVERWRLLDADTLEYQATVEDRKLLTGPWTTPKYLFKRAPADVVPHEALCLQPEDLIHMKAVAEAEKK
jgi:hypothetical protein